MNDSIPGADGPFYDEGEALTYVFQSLRRLNLSTRGPDELSRDTGPTVRLLHATGLLDPPMEYAVVTGSKGKGSTAAITAKLLQHLGHRVGLITSPHLVSFRERIRVDGRAIPEADLVRIVNLLKPFVDPILESLGPQHYFSPQGLFLAIGLQWFAEQGVNAAVLEVGRGGRFDDMAVVPNRLSLITPILLEHVVQLGPSLERIAWHKAGVIEPGSYVYSVPQAPEVLRVLEVEAEARGAEFAWIAPMDMARYLGATPDGIRMALGRYGEVELSLMGRYQVQNATLAVLGAGNVHGRLPGIPHGSLEYVAAIRAGLADVRWPGRLMKLSERPAIYIDGATTVVAARSFLDSLEGRLTEPIVSIVGTPVDRNYAGVYEVMAGASRALILTENNISLNVKFPAPDVALAAARRVHDHVRYAPTLREALDAATAEAGPDGTVLIAAALPIVGEAMQLWGFSFEQI